jgi:CRP/FNR family transcriptional regulator, cyclic AMP receptor protein
MDHHFITFNKDEIIFLEGQSSNCAYIIESGKVGIYREDSQGNRFLVRQLGKKDLFGEMSLIDKYPRSATAIAMKNTRCMIVERSRFDYMKKFHPHFTVSLIKSLTERLRTTIARLNKAEPSRKGVPEIRTTVSDYYDIKGE